MIHGYRCDVKKALSREAMKSQEQKRDRMGRDSRSRGTGRDYGARGGSTAGVARGGWAGWGQGEQLAFVIELKLCKHDSNFIRCKCAVDL